jgi:putative DNA primase/helicase
MTTTNAFLTRAEDLISRGFSVLPLNPRDKAPVPGIGATFATNDSATIARWAERFPEANVGIASDANYTLLETDNESQFRDLVRIETGRELPETATLGSGRPNRCCWVFKRIPECGEACLELPGVFEFRNRNQYVAAPGSIHPTGLEYRWLSNAPIAEFPEWLMPSLEKMSRAYKGEATHDHIKTGPAKLLFNAYRIDLDPEAMFGMDLIIDDGERHYTLQSVAGFLHDGERDADDIYDILTRLRDEYCTPGKGDDELRRIAEYVTKREPYIIEPANLPNWGITWPDGRITVYSTQEAYDAAKARQRKSFAVSWQSLNRKEIPEPPVFIKSGDTTLIRGGSLNEIFAYRGIGKSALVASFIGLLLNGGEFLGFSSDGGYRVLLVDGELPEIDIQNRIREFAKPGDRGELHLRYDGMGDGIRVPKLNTPEAAADFLEFAEELRPDVIIFDTRTAVFGYDTNDTTQSQGVNEFLTSLRRAGFAVLTTHHAGKNGTQRGRTDGDDPLDLIIKLSPREGWKPGDGLQFKLDYEKVRRGDKLQPLEAKYDFGKWSVAKNDFVEKVMLHLMNGDGVATTAAALKTSEYKVKQAKRLLEERNVALPGSKPGRKSKAK